VIDKLSANQRLVLAVVLSFIFFVGYTAVFPPAEEVKQSEAKELTLKNETTTTTTTTSMPSSDISHEIRSDEKESASTLLTTIENEHFIIKIDTLGRISSKVLLDDKYNDKEDGHVELISELGTKPLHVRFADDIINAEASKTAYVASSSNILLDDAQTLTLTQTLSSLTLTKTLTFYPDGHYDIDVKVSDDKRYFIYLGQRPQVGKEMMTVVGAMIYTSDDIANMFEDGDVEGRTSFTGVQLASAFDQYHANIYFDLKPELSLFVERDREDNPIVYIDAQPHMTFKGYTGPKDYNTLKAIDPTLLNAIEYGWFTFVSAPMFKVLLWLHSIFGNWGWAIVALTIIIRILLYPLTYKGMISMQKMKDLAPKIKEIQKKYKGDPQRSQAAVMETYKKAGANPLGGCLPLLLQIPVFFAIYRVLLNAVELQGAEWILWIHDLGKMDPYFVLPILMGATMYYQQKITPSNFQDPMQEKVFKFLPIIFTFFFVTFPAGLVLYWFTNNLFSIAQQFLVNRQFEAIKAARHEQHLAEKTHDKD